MHGESESAVIREGRAVCEGRDVSFALSQSPRLVIAEGCRRGARTIFETPQQFRHVRHAEISLRRKHTHTLNAANAEELSFPLDEKNRASFLYKAKTIFVRAVASRKLE